MRIKKVYFVLVDNLPCNLVVIGRNSRVGIVVALMGGAYLIDSDIVRAVMEFAGCGSPGNRVQRAEAPVQSGNG
jgi:hypothetical protein